MTFQRYCPYCDADRFPTPRGDCADCGRPMPTVPMTNAEVTAGAMALLADYDRRHPAAPELNRKQLAILKTAALRGRMLGKWTDRDLALLESARFITGEMLFASTGNYSAQRLWTITESGRAFLATERAGR